MAPFYSPLTGVTILLSLSAAFVLAAPSLSPRAITLVGEPSVMGEGTYPRAWYINDKTLLGCYRGTRGENAVLETVTSTDSGKTWKFLSTIISVVEETHGLNNCYLYKLPDSNRILAAFRNHERDLVAKKYTKHIMSVCYSDNDGKNWQPLSTVATTNETGLGIWEPLMTSGMDGSLMLFFSRETRTDGKDQNSILVRSTDGGKTWGKEQTISGSGIQKRDGMIGQVRLERGSKEMIVVFESLSPNTGIRSIRSKDDGNTWIEDRRVVYKSAEPATEAAPQVVRVDKTLVVSFSTWEDDRDAKLSNVKIVTSTDSGITWGQKTLVHKNCHWAGEVVIDNGSLLVLSENNGTAISQRISIS